MNPTLTCPEGRGRAGSGALRWKALRAGRRAYVLVSVALVAYCAANGHGQGLVLEPVLSGEQDTGPLHASLGVPYTDLRSPLNFDRVYRVRGDLRRFGITPGQEMYARASNGMVAVFPKSEYVATARGSIAQVPAGTVWVIGEPLTVVQPGGVWEQADEWSGGWRDGARDRARDRAGDRALILPVDTRAAHGFAVARRATPRGQERNGERQASGARLLLRPGLGGGDVPNIFQDEASRRRRVSLRLDEALGG